MQITLHGDYTEQGPNNLSTVHSFEGLYYYQRVDF